MSTNDEARQQDPRVGLCTTCAHARTIVSARGSTFWMCREPSLPKYPPLPVLRCRGFTKRAD